MPDPRDPERIVHPLSTFIRQRLYGLCLGYEALNDHDHLRRDLAWQTAVERDEPLASSPTLCRWGNRADRQVGWRIHEVLVNRFIASFAQAPAELVLDVDATEARVHGKQAGRFFHGYYGDYCFLPLYVFCGEQLLVSYLRPSERGGGFQHGIVQGRQTIAFVSLREQFRFHYACSICQAYYLPKVVDINECSVAHFMRLPAMTRRGNQWE